MNEINHDERQMAIGIRLGVPVELCDGDGLEDVEPLLRAILEEPDGLLAIQAVEQFPRRVAKVEKRFTIGSDEEAFVIGNFEPRQRRGGWREAQGDCERQEHWK